MSNNIMILITVVPVIFIIFIVQILTPKFTRKEIFFGIRLTNEQLKNKEFSQVYRKYVKNNIIVGVIYILILLTILVYFDKVLPIVRGLGILIYLVINFSIYYIANKEARMLKEKFSSSKEKKSAVVIDTKFTKEKSKNMLASPWWFLIPIFIVSLNVIIGINAYDRLPEIIPMHWNALGKVDRWAAKSYGIVFQMPISQLFLTIVMYFSYKIIGWSKQQISASNPEESREQNRIFRYRWSVFIIIINIMMAILLTYTNLNVLGIIKATGKIMMVVPLGFAVIVSVLSIVVSLKTGQGGSRIKLKNQCQSFNNLVDRDDDKYWKLANSIYVNKDDPAIFVEKRFGIGWTMNFGRIESIIITIIFLLLIILMPIISRMLG